MMALVCIFIGIEIQAALGVVIGQALGHQCLQGKYTPGGQCRKTLIKNP